MKEQFVAIGEALIDFIPDHKDCDFDEITAFSPKIGGAPANVCGAFAKLGGKSRLLTQVGNDLFGHKILRGLEHDGIDVSCIALTEKANTSLAFVNLDKNGNREFAFYRKPSADMLYPPESVKPEYFENAFALHFCSVSLGDFPMKEAHKRAISLATEAGAIISFDPNLRFQLWEDREMLRKTVREFLPLADIVKVSDEELEFITGETDPDKALKSLFTGNVKLLVYTCGGEGAHAITQKNAVFCKGRKVSVTDTTGAGDGFIGSFLWKLHDLGVSREDLPDPGEDRLRECLDFSNAFCAISVTRPGAISSYPTPEEMDNTVF